MTLNFKSFAFECWDSGMMHYPTQFLLCGIKSKALVNARQALYLLSAILAILTIVIQKSAVNSRLFFQTCGLSQNQMIQSIKFARKTITLVD